MFSDHEIKIIDSTLREGEQTPGIYFNSIQKASIVEKLIDSSLKDIEIGLIGVSQAENNLLKLIYEKYRSKANIYISSLLKEKHIHIISQIRPENWFLIIPSSELLIKIKLVTSIEDYYLLLGRIIELIKKLKLDIPVIVLEDASRSQTELLENIIKFFCHYGYNKFLYSDTIGSDNLITNNRIQPILKTFPNIELGVHFHNDQGLALANSLMAVKDGASFISASINGMGERSGICDLLQLAFQLHSPSFNISKIADLSMKIADIVGMPVSPNYPIIGKYNFLCSTGTHIAALIKDQNSYAPSLLKIDKNVEYLLGKLSGKEVLRFYIKFNNLDIKVNNDLLEKFKTFNDTSYSNFEESNKAFLQFIKLFKILKNG